MGNFRFSAPDQEWSDEVIKELRERYKVIYNKGVFGIRIILRKDNNPLFEILMEDDGNLFSPSCNSTTFDYMWSDDLIEVLTQAKEFCKKIYHKLV